MDPIVDGLKASYGDRLNFERVNVGDSAGKQLAREQGCIGQPAFVFFDRSGEQTRRLMGAQTAAAFEQEFERLLGQP
jgi:hypothetical protein